MGVAEAKAKEKIARDIMERQEQSKIDGADSTDDKDDSD